MKFEGICIAVKDIHKSRSFYESIFGVNVISDYGINITFDVGFSLQQEFDWLLGIDKKEIQTKENNFELYFEENNFDMFIEQLKERTDITYLHDVKTSSWGQRCIRFYDIDNHLIEVGENLKAVVERFQSQGNSIEEVAKLMDISVREIELILQ